MKDVEMDQKDLGDTNGKLGELAHITGPLGLSMSMSCFTALCNFYIEMAKHSRESSWFQTGSPFADLTLGSYCIRVSEAPMWTSKAKTQPKLSAAFILPHTEVSSSRG